MGMKKGAVETAPAKTKLYRLGTGFALHESQIYGLRTKSIFFQPQNEPLIQRNEPQHRLISGNYMH